MRARSGGAMSPSRAAARPATRPVAARSASGAAAAARAGHCGSSEPYNEHACEQRETERRHHHAVNEAAGREPQHDAMLPTFDDAAQEVALDAGHQRGAAVYRPGPAVVKALVERDDSR